MFALSMKILIILILHKCQNLLNFVQNTQLNLIFYSEEKCQKNSKAGESSSKRVNTGEKQIGADKIVTLHKK